MKITLKLYGNLKRFAPQKRENITLEISPGTTIADLFAHLGVPDSNVSMCAVNDVVVDSSTPLHDGDVVEVFEPVGGGSQIFWTRPQGCCKVGSGDQPTQGGFG